MPLVCCGIVATTDQMKVETMMTITAMSAIQPRGFVVEITWSRRSGDRPWGAAVAAAVGLVAAGAGEGVLMVLQFSSREPKRLRCT